MERKMTIVTDPPGAKVTINGREVGFSPVNYSFIYYGKYRIMLQKDGYQTRVIEDRVPRRFMSIHHSIFWQRVSIRSSFTISTC